MEDARSVGAGRPSTLTKILLPDDGALSSTPGGRPEEKRGGGENVIPAPRGSGGAEPPPAAKNRRRFELGWHHRASTDAEILPGWRIALAGRVLSAVVVPLSPPRAENYATDWGLRFSWTATTPEQ